MLATVVGAGSWGTTFAAVLADAGCEVRIWGRDDAVCRQIATEHLALIPLALYFKEGRVKVELGVARGRKKADKRQAMAERDSKLEMAKALGRRMKGTDR